MKISRLEPNQAFYRACQQALEALLAQPTDKQARPCPDCAIACPCCGSPSCTCNCSSTCVHAPRQMSSEPDTLPIEPGIVPLVYALQSLRVCPPCWSCEGHVDPSGKLGKVPRVWFYAQSLAYPNLLAAHLSQLRIDRELAFPWCIRIVHWGDPLETAFSIEPSLGPRDAANLDRLREDAARIAAGLPSDVRRLAGDRVAKLNAILNALR